MMGSSMLALKYVSVGAFVVVRNLGPLVTLVMEVALHKPDNLTCNARTAGATLAIAAGVWMYEANPNLDPNPNPNPNPNQVCGCTRPTT